MDIQRLRNLTTGRLHTKMDDIYQDIEFITGSPGIMTHQIPNANRSIEPWLHKKVTDEWFWDDKYDTSHVGDYPIEPMNDQEREEMFKIFSSLPSPLFG